MQWYNNLKIRTKLNVAFVAVSLVAGVNGVVGVTKTKELKEIGDKIYTLNTRPLINIGDVAAIFQRERVYLRDMVIDRDPALKSRHADAIRELDRKIEVELGEFEKGIKAPEERQAYEGLKNAIAAYDPVRAETMRLATAGREDEAVALMRSQGLQMMKPIDESIKALSGLKSKQAEGRAAEQAAIASGVERLLIILTIVGTLGAIGIGFFLASFICVRLNRIVVAMGKVAEGDLSTQLRIYANDEIGALGRSINDMIHSLSSMAASIRGSAEQVAAAASQLCSTSDRMATGAEEVASQAGTVATAGEEMAATSTEIAHNCGMAAQGAQQANDSARAGAEVVEKTVSMMEQIARRVRETAQTVESLGARSDQIGEIVRTIEDIADQTNLLALNAAIEAARAGEQGRGFAVVADEVRALAERTTKATKEIGTMIRAIQSETKGAVAAMEEGVKDVSEGTSEATRSGEALHEILNQISNVTMQVSQIATAAEQQTATTTEISSNMQQITHVVGETARGAQESAMAASTLTNLAEELQNQIGRFQLA